MEITLHQLGVGVLIFLTGLSAGLCYTWSNAVTTGIGKLDDFGYLNAFQQMNRAILNPTFLIVFFGPLLVGPINVFLHKNVLGSMFWFLVLAVVLYVVGVVLVTIFGNVPLNEILDKTDLCKATSEEMESLRTLFELRWNQLHLIRTLSAVTSLAILLAGLVIT